MHLVVKKLSCKDYVGGKNATNTAVANRGTIPARKI